MSISVSTGTDIARPDFARDSAVQRTAVPADAKADGSRSAPAQQQMNSETAAKLVEDIQKKIDSMNVSITFSTYGSNRNIAVKVIEKTSGDVIREIPPKELQQLADKLDEMIGLIFSKSA
ncbi:MAG: flagellar protein FlaG [Syntrophaceae bacterium]